MTQSNPPLGYITPQTPESASDFRSIRVSDDAISTVKSAVQGYIDSFLNPNGTNRQFATATLSPRAIQYVTSLTYDDEMKESPNQRKLYLARFLAENSGKLPAILIVDAGAEYIDMGLNDLVGVTRRGGLWQGEFLFFIKVTLSIIAATLSAEDTDSLGSYLMLMFGPLANATVNHILKQPGQSWEVRLPLTMTPGSATSTPIEGDSKTSIWSRNLDIVCDFESLIGIEQKEANFTPEAAVFGNTERENPLPNIINLSPNQSIPLGSPYQLVIENLRISHYLGTSDPNIALVTMEPPFFIYPRRQGKVFLYIYDRDLPAEPTPEENQCNPRLVLDIPFRITT